jgi:acetyl esterase/lipase
MRRKARFGATMEAPDNLSVRDIVVQGADNALAARLYTTQNSNNALMVFFHSGGFCGGDIEDADQFLRLAASANPGAAVLAANYRLADASPFPAAVDDAYAVLQWATRNKAQLNWQGQYLFAAGIEAGANLAAVCALMARDRAEPALAGQILITPMLDPSLSTVSMRRESERDTALAGLTDGLAAAYRGYLPNAADRFHPYASPLATMRLQRLAPALILSVEGDPLMDEAEHYGARLITAGVRTSVRRLPPVDVYDAAARNECACRVTPLAELNGFLGMAVDYRIPTQLAPRRQAGCT